MLGDTGVSVLEIRDVGYIHLGLFFGKSTLIHRTIRVGDHIGRITYQVSNMSPEELIEANFKAIIIEYIYLRAESCSFSIINSFHSELGGIIINFTAMELPCLIRSQLDILPHTSGFVIHYRESLIGFHYLGFIPHNRFGHLHGTPRGVESFDWHLEYYNRHIEFPEIAGDHLPLHFPRPHCRSI